MVFNHLHTTHSLLNSYHFNLNMNKIRLNFESIWYFWSHIYLFFWPIHHFFYLIFYFPFERRNTKQVYDALDIPIRRNFLNRLEHIYFIYFNCSTHAYNPFQHLSIFICRCCCWSRYHWNYQLIRFSFYWCCVYINTSYLLDSFIYSYIIR